MAKNKKKSYSSVAKKAPQLKGETTEVREINGFKTFADENKHWYDLPEEQIAAAIKQVVTQIDDNNRDLSNINQTYAGMYGNLTSWGTVNTSFGSGDAGFDSATNLPSYNVVQSSVDTIAAKITKDNPKPVFLTTGAQDYFTRLKAEKQTQFVQGIFDHAKVYDKANNSVFRDGAVYGLGALLFRLDKKNNLPDCDWVFIDEIKIDRIDAMKKTPRSIHLCCIVQKELLETRYPDKADKLNGLVTQHPEWFRSKDTVTEVMIVTLSWHLQNGDRPGKHVVCVEDVVLENEEYNSDIFPVALFSYYDAPAGIYGRGVAATLYDHQIEINKLLLQIQQCQELQAAPLIFVPNGSQVAADVLLSNNIARMVPYNPTQGEIRFVSPQACDPAIYEHLRWWIAASYQEIGVSLTSVSGTKQAGVNSAIAIRTMVDVESARYINVHKNWEKFFVDCAKICIQLVEQAYQKNKDLKITYLDKKSRILKEIFYKDIRSDELPSSIIIDTMSSFPDTFAGRIQTATDFISNGWFNKETGLELIGMNNPDLYEQVKLETASLRLCEKRLSQMVEEGEYNHPEPFMDLQISQKVSQQFYNQLLIDDCPEDRLQLVRNWIDELLQLQGVPDPVTQQLQALYAPPPPMPQPGVAPQTGISPA